MAARARLQRRDARWYRTLGGLMAAFPIVGLLLSWRLGQRYAAVFFIEAAGIWPFGLYWLAKSWEMSKTA